MKRSQTDSITMDNAKIVSFVNSKDLNEYEKMKRAYEASARFFSSAMLLSEGEFLGMQINAESLSCIIFSSSNAKVSEEDYCWIFQKCATVFSKDTYEAEDLYTGSRRVYLISKTETVLDSAFCNSLGPYSNKYPIKDLLFDLLQILAQEGAVIRIVVGQGSKSGDSYGRVYISLKDEMPLRLRSSLALAFPNTLAIEVHKVSSYECIDFNLPNETVIECLSIYNYLLLCRQKGAKQDAENRINKDVSDHRNLYIDFVFAIDKTNPKIIAMASDIIYITLKKLIESAEIIDKNAIFRVKAVGFGDLSKVPFYETGFYNCDEYEAFLGKINAMECENGTRDGKVDAFEAICTALQSEWTTEKRSRHCIILLSNSTTNEFGTNRNSKHYPTNMPDSFTTIADWWHGMKSFSNTYTVKSGRLISIAYKRDPLTALESWDRYWPVYIGKTFNPFDIECMFDLILGRF